MIRNAILFVVLFAGLSCKVEAKQYCPKTCEKQEKSCLKTQFDALLNSTKGSHNNYFISNINFTSGGIVYEFKNVTVKLENYQVRKVWYQNSTLHCIGDFPLVNLTGIYENKKNRHSFNISANNINGSLHLRLDDHNGKMFIHPETSSTKVSVEGFTLQTDVEAYNAFYKADVIDHLNEKVSAAAKPVVVKIFSGALNGCRHANSFEEVPDA